MHIYKFSLPLAVAVLWGGMSLADGPPVKIEQGWVRAVPPSSSDSVAYMTLVNISDQPIRLTGASTPVAEMVRPMVTTKKTMRDQEVVGMKMVGELVIPAHDRLILSAEGDHLMLMSLKKHSKPGEKVKLTLHFEPGGRELTMEFPVALHTP